MKYLSKDPYKTAGFVREKLLAADRLEEALLLTQKSSKYGQMVVAWNHLIDYQLSKQRLGAATTTYNEAGLPSPNCRSNRRS